MRIQMLSRQGQQQLSAPCFKSSHAKNTNPNQILTGTYLPIITIF